MKRIAALYRRLDETTKTSRKIAHLKQYFATAAPADAAWGVLFLGGRRVKRLIRSADLRRWAYEAAGIPDWLLDECYDAVGDVAETIALLLPEPAQTSDLPLSTWADTLLSLQGLEPQAQRATVVEAWQKLDRTERLVWNKLITGEFRVGVSQTLITRALAETAGVTPAVVAHRLMGDWQPTADFYRGLFTESTADADVSRPYPFCLAHPLEAPPETLGDRRDWRVEWKWDGIRAQCIRRHGTTSLWSRGEELITDRFPELHAEAAELPDGTVLDGEVVAWRDGGVLPFGALQRRIGRKSLGKKILDEVPVRYIAFDLLEDAGRDLRDRPLVERRRRLEELIGSDAAPSRKFMPSPIETAVDWQQLASRRDESRGRNVEGFMLKRLDGPYAVGRVTGLWWKWKIDPHTIDAVLIYAQRGSGRRASLYTDYTFGIWKDGELVPFAKAYSGLTDDEIRDVDRFVRQNTLEKFGPVRRVKPELVFELAFENIQLSTRHKAGIAVRFPRMVRQRTDKQPADADTLETIKQLLRPT